MKQVFSAKVCQDNGKALMTNPNRELGKWLLRDILKIPVGQLATQEDLDLAGIDSIYIEKIDKDNYLIDFAATGKYEQFKEDYLTPAS